MKTSETTKEVLKIIGYIILVILVIIISAILERWPLYFILKWLKNK